MLLQFKDSGIWINGEHFPFDNMIDAVSFIAGHKNKWWVLVPNEKPFHTNNALDIILDKFIEVNNGRH